MESNFASLFVSTITSKSYDDQLRIYAQLRTLLDKPEKFIIKYKYTTAFLDEDADGELREDDLSRINLFKCFNYLIEEYPDRKITVEDAHKCLSIFKLVLIYATSYEYMDDYIHIKNCKKEYVDIYYETFRKAGVFSHKKATLASSLFSHHIKLRFICVDMAEDYDKLDKYTLEELLHDDQKYNIFIDFWSNLPKYNFD